jgi:hypothetical protein
VRDASLLSSVKVLTGLDPDRVTAARDEVRRWGFQHVCDELLSGTIDAAVAATLYVEAVNRLVEQGVERRQAHRKIRQEPNVWSTFAEIRAAELLLRGLDGEIEVRLEHGRSRAAHADLRFVMPALSWAQSVEVKAIGLSDDETQFCKRMAPSLGALLPRAGLVHIHAPIDAAPPRLDREQRRQLARQSKKAAERTPEYPEGLRGTVIVGHGSEDAYVRRAVGRVIQAIRQLPAEDECWVAIYWSNGAPIESVHRALRWPEIPSHVVGISLVGCGVAFPHAEIHCFSSWLHRDATEDDDLIVASANEGQDELASLVLNRFERSSGVRPTLLQFGEEIGLLRDGRRRILPFNLVMDPDPRGIGRSASGPEISARPSRDAR